MTNTRPSKAHDLSGMKFGKWRAIDRAENGKSGSPRWRCLCDCGTERNVLAMSLAAGSSKSCGCAPKNWPLEPAFKDRKERTMFYGIWKNIVQRCENPKNKRYASYGARGIHICDRWRQDFVAFAVDMGPRPHGYTVERIDNDKGYCPANCRWASRSEQALNTSRNRFVEYKGQPVPLVVAARLSGINYDVAKNRLNRGVPQEDVFK